MNDLFTDSGWNLPQADSDTDLSADFHRGGAPWRVKKMRWGRQGSHRGYSSKQWPLWDRMKTKQKTLDSGSTQAIMLEGWPKGITAPAFPAKKTGRLFSGAFSKSIPPIRIEIKMQTEGIKGTGTLTPLTCSSQYSVLLPSPLISHHALRDKHHTSTYKLTIADKLITVRRYRLSSNTYTTFNI